MATSLRSARKHYRLSALLARRGARKAFASRRNGPLALATILGTYQAAQAVMSQDAVAAMLAEQQIDGVAVAPLNPLAFTTSAPVFEQMLEPVLERDVAAEFDRLVESLIQDAGRAAESVACTAIPDIWHVRFLSPPSCARCAVLAGRVYRYSDGFLRHPNCDCVMVPTTAASPLRQDPVDLLERGLITGLSKADVQAVRDGADLSQVVNVRLRRAGLSQAGRVLARNGRLTPEGVYAATDGREEAVDLLRAQGYLL